jgi:hypothetical protein
MTLTIDHVEVLRSSAKFQQWRRKSVLENGDGLLTLKMMAERHYKPEELAELWQVSTQTIRNVFKDEKDVIRLQGPTEGKRAYTTLRIPESVVRRVHNRLTAKAQ